MIIFVYLPHPFRYIPVSIYIFPHFCSRCDRFIFIVVLVIIIFFFFYYHRYVLRIRRIGKYFFIFFFTVYATSNQFNFLVRTCVCVRVLRMGERYVDGYYRLFLFDYCIRLCFSHFEILLLPFGKIILVSSGVVL